MVECRVLSVECWMLSVGCCEPQTLNTGPHSSNPGCRFLLSRSLRSHSPQIYLTERVSDLCFKKSISAQIRQLILYISNNEGSVDGFVRKLTFAK